MILLSMLGHKHLPHYSVLVYINHRGTLCVCGWSYVYVKTSVGFKPPWAADVVLHRNAAAN